MENYTSTRSIHKQTPCTKSGSENWSCSSRAGPWVQPFPLGLELHTGTSCLLAPYTGPNQHMGPYHLAYWAPHGSQNLVTGKCGTINCHRTLRATPLNTATANTPLPNFLTYEEAPQTVWLGSMGWTLNTNALNYKKFPGMHCLKGETKSAWDQV